MGSQLQSLEQVKVSVVDMLVKFGPKLLVAIIILALGYIKGRGQTKKPAAFLLLGPLAGAASRLMGVNVA